MFWHSHLCYALPYVMSVQMRLRYYLHLKQHSEHGLAHSTLGFDWQEGKFKTCNQLQALLGARINKPTVSDLVCDRTFLSSEVPRVSLQLCTYPGNRMKGETNCSSAPPSLPCQSHSPTYVTTIPEADKGCSCWTQNGQVSCNSSSFTYGENTVVK